jgi:D-glycero-D-manno-heptose 1,7-bisphosphate phosphatase
MRRAAFLDRDGVLLRLVREQGVVRGARDLGEVTVADGVAEALRLLGDAGFLRIVVTNQPDVARGRLTAGAVEDIHRYMRQRLALDAIYWCGHDDADRCDCRKPRPGMLRCASFEHQLDLQQSVIFGDRMTDIRAGLRVGCRGILVVGDAQPDSLEVGSPQTTAFNLLSGVGDLLRRPTNDPSDELSHGVGR